MKINQNRCATITCTTVCMSVSANEPCPVTMRTAWRSSRIYADSLGYGMISITSSRALYSHARSIYTRACMARRTRIYLDAQLLFGTSCGGGINRALHQRATSCERHNTGRTNTIIYACHGNKKGVLRFT